MSSTVQLLTVAEYEKIAPPPGGRYELHHGELVLVTFPTHQHNRIQRRLLRLLEERLSAYGEAATEFAFRPEPEHELWAADVAVASEARSESIQPAGWLFGAPELVIEVLSPTNTAAEMNEREQMCLRNGCLEFWVVDPKLRLVKVSTPGGSTVTYIQEKEIPLTRFGGSSPPVAAIFEP